MFLNNNCYLYLYMGVDLKMKNQIFAFLCTIIIIGIPIVTGDISNNLQEIENVSIDDNTPIWELGDFWTYDINRFQANFSATGAIIGIDSTLDDLTMEVIGYSESSYILGLSGRIKGYFEYESGEGIVLKGNLLFTKLSGNMYIRQNDLSNEKVNIVINGIVVLSRHPLQIPIPIPIPLTITINVNQDIPRSIIDFPLYNGKQGLINETVISADIRFESVFLRILSLFFADVPSDIYYEESFNIPMFDYSANTENISVEAGVFDTYKIQFGQGLVGSIFYAPSVGNLVKSEIVIEMTDQFMVLLIGELRSFNYQ